MYIEGVPIEVKSLSWDPRLTPTKYIQKLIERATRAFRRQHAQLAALDIGTALAVLGLTNMRRRRTDQSMKDFCLTLRNALSLAKRRKNPVLLFHRDPWIGTVDAKVEALSKLEEILP